MNFSSAFVYADKLKMTREQLFTRTMSTRQNDPSKNVKKKDRKILIQPQSHLKRILKKVHIILIFCDRKKSMQK